MSRDEFGGLNPYSGALTPQQAAQGIAAARQNARELYEEALILLKHERLARSVTLSILAIEEAGKIPLLRELLLVQADKAVRSVWRSYRRHTSKNVMATFIDFVKQYPVIEDFRPLFEPSSDLPKIVESLKQISAHSDCLADAHWSLPAKVIDEKLARTMTESARLFAGRGPSSFETEQELELWVKYLQPVWQKNPSLMKKALIACYRDAETRGILRGTSSADELIGFIA